MSRLTKIFSRNTKICSFQYVGSKKSFWFKGHEKPGPNPICPFTSLGQVMAHLFEKMFGHGRKFLL